MNCSIIIPSHFMPLAKEAKDCLPGFDITIFNGKGYPSYSKLINDCILAAKEEIVIIMNHKIRPTSFHIHKIIELLNKGYGLVSLQNFYFYGFKKDLIRTIGFFDERFIGGGYEDADFGKRFIENDIALYIGVEAPLLRMKTTWNFDKSHEFYIKKWEETRTGWKRLLPDEKYDYDLGPMVNENNNWMPFKNSLLCKTSLLCHKQIKYFNDKSINLFDLGCSE